jgi:outer membrane protein OmpA-like peptidoglycan-associated protein
LLALVLLPSAAVRADDVKVFEKPPSLEELQNALGTKGGKPKMVTRSIQIDDDGSAPPPAAAPVAAPVAAPSAAPAYTPAPSVAPAYAPAPVSKPVTPARPRPQPAPATAQVSEKAVAMRINFDYNSANLRPESLPFVESIAQLLKAEPQSSLVIEGHTDAAGSYAYNLQLSKARAGAVRNILINTYGVYAGRLIAVGKGPSEPLNAADPTSPDNRRVQFRLRG